VRIIGSQFRVFQDGSADLPAEIFDRHVRAFGSELQPVLQQLHVGITGCGGTGSSVAEQMIRLGIGTLTVVDGGKLEASNVTRGYGSEVFDAGLGKTEIIKRLAAHIGLGTQVRAIGKNCTYASTVRALRDCDVIFGCTDDQWGRSLLNRLAIYYLIPVFDMGVRFYSEAGKIQSIQGRVTTLLPGMACLYCRKRISADVIRQESIDALSPSEAASLRKEGYIPELEGPAASVIPFTTAIAAAAVNELLHRLTQFGGSGRTATEVLHFFDQSRIRTNSTPPQPDCICSDPNLAGRGDCEPLLDCTWRPE
jgi:molybdopterin/thiamine biosynthesis adenylyltransferase